MPRSLDPTSAYLAISDRERATAAGDDVERRAAEAMRLSGARAGERETVFPDGATGSLRYAVRAYDPSELIALLDEAGFACPGPFGATDGSGQVDGDPNVIVARTRGRARTSRV